MKTPDEIKKGLECCSAPREDEQCRQCPYAPNNGYCVDKLTRDALWYMVELKAENVQRADRIIRLEAERDALLKYITDSTWAACDICKHGIDGASILDCKHIREVGVPCFEWRGVQKEE